MSTRGEVLVAIINNLLDFAIVRERQWYRIPVSSVGRFMKDRWPPKWLAFYQTQVFGREKYAVKYYAEVMEIREALRGQLFPDEPPGEKSERRYYQLILGPLQRLPQPIISRRWRRILFIPTTWEKFIQAIEINDLFDESPLENRLWAEFQRLRILAERQELVQVKKNHYLLDFAIYCASGKLDVETDGDSWHATPQRAAQDNLRDNDLKTVGWRVLRFNTQQIREDMEDYTLPTITDNINNLGGIEEGKIVPRKIDPEAPDDTYQMSLPDGSKDPEDE